MLSCNEHEHEMRESVDQMKLKANVYARFHIAVAWRDAPKCGWCWMRAGVEWAEARGKVPFNVPR